MGQNILVVDDTPENLRLLANILTGRGYKVRLAPSGAHALVSVQKNPPDLILLDIMMPGMGGYEVCQQLKAEERTRDIPVIFISALDDVFDKMTAFSVGGVDYITKPLEEAEVLARVKTHLTLRQLQQELWQKNHALQAANESLEEKVRARTAALTEANITLKLEIEQRMRHQEEKDRLFNVVSQQSEQLRYLTNRLLETQQQGLAAGLQAEIEQNMALLKLTSREREVLRLLAQGKTNAEIASLLTVAVTTIHTYTSRIKEKLDIQNLPGLIKFAIEHNLAE